MKSTITPRTSARWIGALMLAAFLLYGVGTSIAISSAVGSAPLAVGVAMMLVNTVAVVAIGALVFPILRAHAPAVAVVYLTARILEGTLLAVGAIALVTGALTNNTLAYNLAMTGLGIGSMFFCVVLYRTRLVPRFLAVWGFIGYAAFASGCVLELLGVAGAGVPATIPGGLFEVFFAIWLLARGFNSSAAIPVATPVADRA